jgi:hypothetical protein
MTGTKPRNMHGLDQPDALQYQVQSALKTAGAQQSTVQTTGTAGCGNRSPAEWQPVQTHTDMQTNMRAVCHGVNCVKCSLAVRS